ncbi:Hydroxyethylthiazole kinase family-domain-containing protein [Dipodascopsis tothii]|uniref:Hydroxyethylthiazole kinase family-domain-containing protein n=1 Tax=Dipodascopsis tothii TaxID=44089 RepID=UPI0034CE7EE1
MAAIDYSVYFVTDSGMIPEGSSLVEQVRRAVAGGATIVQLREKDTETRDFIERARAVHAITKAAGVPLLINDRLDVALAIDAEGVHIGQDDIDVPTARRLLGPGKVVGLSVTYVHEAEAAYAAGVDYIGVGTVYNTATKTPKHAPIGLAGLRAILAYLAPLPRYLPAVAIGSMNPTNTRMVVHQTAVGARRLDGVAVVSAIMASREPEAVVRDLLAQVKVPPHWAQPAPARQASDAVLAAGALTAAVRRTTPLVHNIINRVVTNFAANADLAVGASPIMTENVPEFGDISSIPSAGLLLNMGFATDDMVDMYLSAVREYNVRQRPVVYDPVGAGASALRRAAVKKLLDRGHYDVIKGNEGEIFSVAGQASAMRGVDSTSAAPLEARVAVVKALAAQEKTVVAMTGAEDVISDGATTYVVRNGHSLLADITGSGCSLGSIVVGYVAVAQTDALLATLAAVLHYTIAGERAAAGAGVRGPGTFVPAFLDELYLVSKESAAGDLAWLGAARVELVK